MQLTNDMVPIHSTEEEYHFICPLPTDYEKFILQTSSIEEIKKYLSEVVLKINALAKKETGSFINIMIEYQERTEEEKKHIKKSLVIERADVDNRGLFVALAGKDVSSGNVFLDTRSSIFCDYSAIGFKEFFESGVSFKCHNVDFYWQALLLRELTVNYFNFLNGKLNNQR